MSLRLRMCWLAVCAAAAIGCDDPLFGEPDSGEEPDAGQDSGAVDPCEGLTLCETAGTSCDGQTLVTCEENSDGCMVEATTECAATDDVCDDTSGTAACVNPCSLVPEEDRCTAEGRSCDGDTLEICSLNVDGCLVAERTDCADAAGGVCDDTGAMPMCVLPTDACAALPAADRCDAAGTSCDGETLVTCEADAFGCLVLERTDCTARASGVCDDSATAECTFTGDPCDGITQCAPADAACDGPSLRECELDGYGCFVETVTDCSDTTFGFCDDNPAGADRCSTAGTDPCLGEDECGTTASRTCDDRSTLNECEANAFGCFVAEVTDCTTDGDVCDAASGPARCVNPCSLVVSCTAAMYCDGTSGELVTCAANADGCLVESARMACAADEVCFDDAGAVACIDPCSLVTECPSASYCDAVSDEVVTCAANADGCLVESTRVTCNPGDRCDVNGTTASCEGVCSDVTLCPSATYCDGATSELVTCANNADGCLVETSRSACVAPELCEESAGSASCIDHCAGLTVCPSAAYCDGTSGELVTCVANADGCLLETSRMACGSGTRCSAGACVDPCTLVTTCPSASYCDAAADAAVSCAPNADGCLVETARTGCGASAFCSVAAGTAGCTPTCPEAGARVLTCASGTASGSTAMGSTAINGPYPGCTTSTSYTGREEIWRFQTGLGAPVNVQITSTRLSGTADFDLFVLDGGNETSTCTAATGRTCISGSDGTAATETVNFIGQPGQTEYVVYDIFSTADTTGYTLAVNCATQEPNAICDGAVELTPLTGQDLRAGGAPPTGLNCGTTLGPVLYYWVEVLPGTFTTVTATPTGALPWDITLRTLADCSGACLSNVNSTTTTGAPERVLLQNPTTETQMRLVAVGANSNAYGTFNLAVTSSPFPTNTMCSAPQPVTAGTTTIGELALGGPRPTGTLCGTFASSVLYYTVDVPPGEYLSLLATPITSFDLALRTLDDCSGNCTANINSSTTSGAPERVTFTNETGATITRLVAVGANSATTFGPFSLAASGGPLPSNRVCMSPMLLPVGSALNGDIVPGGARPTGASCGTSVAPVTYYQVDILPGTYVTVTGTPTGAPAWDLSLRTLGDCTGACLTAVDSFGVGLPERAVLSNETGATITRIIAVGGVSAATHGTFTISAASTPLPPNRGCMAPSLLALGSTTSGNLLGGGPRPTGASCGTSAGPVLYYQVEIPPTSYITVTGTPTGAPAWDITLRSLADCSGACLANVDSGASGVLDRMLITNPTAATVTRLIAVGADSATTFGTFDLSVVGASFPAHSTCAGALPITSSTQILAENIVLGGARPAGTGCGGGTGNNAYYYAVTVAPGGTAVVRTNPGLDIVLSTEDSCGAAACLTTTDSSPETVTITNSGAAPITRIVVVRNYGATGTGTFDISFFMCGDGIPSGPEGCDDGMNVTGDGCSATCAVEPNYACSGTPSVCTIPYARAPIAGACLDTTGGVVAAGVTTDDSASAIAALPFAFTYFGGPVTHWSASSNGNVQLFPSGTGTASTAYSNVTMPDTAVPNGFVAPFWDDMIPLATPIVRSAVFGAPGSRTFVVEWNGWRPTSSSTATTRFQAHLLEGSNVIEFHYCSMTESGTATYHTGQSATIGIENLTGTGASLQSFNTIGAVMTGSGFRFTPN